MKIIGKTKLEKLNILLIVTGVLMCILLISRYFVIGGIILIIFVFVLRMWFRCLYEEAVISFLKRNGGQCVSAELIKEYSSEKILLAVSRLEKKGIVTVQDNKIILRDLNRQWTFDT